MGNEVELISDGDGLAVIGDAEAVERFLAAEGLPSKDLGLDRLGGLLPAGASLCKPPPTSLQTQGVGCS